MFGIFADLLSSIITILFPAFASYRAIRSGNPEQLTPWLMYWVVLSGILLAESWTVFIIGWFPFYSWIRLFFLSYLVLPQTQGARILYQEYVDPFFEEHDREIEEVIGRTHERAKALGLGYFYQIVDIIREKLLGMPAQQQQQQQAAVPQPASAAEYAQSLFARFNQPPPTSGGADWSSWASTAIGIVTQSRGAPAEQSHTRGTREREESTYRPNNTGGNSSDDDLAYGHVPQRSSSSSGLRKNASEHSFDQIDAEELRGLSSTSKYTENNAEGVAGWTSGWFGSTGGGGQKRPSAGSKRSASGSSGVDFAARAADEIGRASGFSR